MKKPAPRPRLPTVAGSARPPRGSPIRDVLSRGLDPSRLMSASQVLGQSVFRGLLSSMWVELAIQGTGCVAGVRPSGIPSPGGRRITSRPRALGGPRSVSAHRLATGQPPPGGRAAAGGKPFLCRGRRILGPRAASSDFLLGTHVHAGRAFSGQATTCRFTPPGVSDEGDGPSRRPVGRRRAGDSRPRGGRDLQPRPFLRPVAGGGHG